MLKLALNFLRNNLDKIFEAFAELIVKNPDTKIVEGLKKSEKAIDTFYNAFDGIRDKVRENISKEDIINELKD